MKFVTIICIALLFVACSTSPNNTQAEETAEETVEMEAESAMEEEVEVAEESTSDPYALMDLPCKSDGLLVLKNFYQLNQTEMARLDQEDRYYGNILNLQWAFRTKINHCKKSDDGNIITTSLDYFSQGLEYRQTVREDLLPSLEEQMMILPEPLVNFAISNLVPDPSETQVNNITYQVIYDYYRVEFRKLYYAYLLLSKYSSWEKELRAYALAANTITITSEETVRKIDNYPSFISFIQKYSYPEWAYSTSAGTDLGDDYEWYCAFWMRRGLDGSFDELIELQEKIVKLYDANWFERVTEKTSKLPSIQFDEDRIVNSDSSYQFIDDAEELKKYVTVADNGFLVTFENGKSRIFSDGEYNSYGLSGYIPEKKYYLIEEFTEVVSSFLLDKQTGETHGFGGTLSSIKFSPDGSLFLADETSEIGSYASIYKFIDGKPGLVFTSGLLNAINMDWISNSEIQMKTGFGGNVFIDLSNNVSD